LAKSSTYTKLELLKDDKLLSLISGCTFLNSYYDSASGTMKFGFVKNL